MQHLEDEELKFNKQTTLLDHLMEAQKDFADEFEEYFISLQVPYDQVCFDLTMRNVLQDCLDFDDPIQINTYFLNFLNFVGQNGSESLTSKEIMVGLMARILGMDDPYGEFSLAFAEQMGAGTPAFAMEVIKSGIPLSTSDELAFYPVDCCTSANLNDIIADFAIQID